MKRETILADLGNERRVIYNDSAGKPQGVYGLLARLALSSDGKGKEILYLWVTSLHIGEAGWTTQIQVDRIRSIETV